MLIAIAIMLLVSWIPDVRQFTIDLDELKSLPNKEAADEFIWTIALVAILVGSLWKVIGSLYLLMLRFGGGE